MIAYRDSNTDIVFEHPHAGPLDVAIYRDYELVREEAAVVKIGSGFPLTLSYEETAFDGNVKIVWTATDFERTMSVKVVTPIVRLDRLATLTTDVTELETAVRMVVEGYTGVSFGYYEGTYLVETDWGGLLNLPQHLLKLEGISTAGVNIDTSYYTLNSGGWVLEEDYPTMLTIKQAPPEEFMDNVFNGVIYIPSWYQHRNPGVYGITGEWGFYQVPEDVQEAAWLLANDYACDESLYRDRYMEIVKFADTNFRFSSLAFDGTGNARADLLLAHYRKSQLAVI